MSSRRLGRLADAAVAGVVDCSAYDYSPRWWLATTLKLRSFQRKVEAEATAMHFKIILAQLASAEYSGKEAVQTAHVVISDWENQVAPWLSNKAMEAFTQERLMAMWYINYAPWSING